MFITANVSSVHTVCTVYITLTKHEGCTGRTSAQGVDTVWTGVMQGLYKEKTEGRCSSGIVPNKLGY